MKSLDYARIFSNSLALDNYDFQLFVLNFTEIRSLISVCKFCITKLKKNSSNSRAFLLWNSSMHEFLISNNYWSWGLWRVRQILDWIKMYHRSLSRRNRLAWQKKSDFERRGKRKEIEESFHTHWKEREFLNVHNLQFLFEIAIWITEAEIMFREDRSSGFFVNRR